MQPHDSHPLNLVTHTMHPTMSNHRRSPLQHAAVLCLLLLGSGLFLMGDSAQGQQARSLTDGKSPNSSAAQGITLNFVGAEVEAVTRAMATLTGRHVVVDPRVRGTMTLTSERSVTQGQAWQLFAMHLRAMNFALIEQGNMYLVVPESDARLHAGPVGVGQVSAASGQVVTQIFQLRHETAAQLVPILRPLISPNNTINVSASGNALVVTDHSDNLRRLEKLINALDAASATGYDVIDLQHTLAQDLAPMLLRLTEGAATAGPGASEGQGRTQILADARSNKLLVRAPNAARLLTLRTLIEQLDQPSSLGAGGNIHVVQLRNADASKLAQTLRAAISGQSSTASGPAATALPGGAGTAAGSASAPTTGGQVQADVATNSLIITAAEPQLRQLRAIIEQLDTRRAQVFVESLIAEINDDTAAEFGIQWQGPVGKEGDGTVGLLGTNFTVGGSNLLSIATGKATPSTGFNFGIATRANGRYFLSFLGRFIESSGNGNVLSTPNLLTLDNEEAKIVIGQNVPFITGQFTNNNTNTTNPFQTIERKDVGLTLRVKPQISENGTVRMQIFQEVSRVESTGATGPITNKRSIESNVLVEDGSIVVLGGLLQDDFQGKDQRVPGLANLPVLGHLFKAQARERKKTNLMIFLRPVVVRDGAATYSLSQDRYDQIRARQQQTQPVPSAVVPINESVILPSLNPPKNGDSQPVSPPPQR
jgi:general secretion pathway protein D